MIRKAITLIFITIFLLSSSFAVMAQTGSQTTGASAQSQATGNSPDPQTTGSNTKTTALQNPLKVNSIGAAVNEGAKIFSFIAVLFGVIMLIWVGFQFILARGNPDRLSELKSWLLWIVVGLAIVIGARLIIQVVVNTLDATDLVDDSVIQSANQAIIGK